MFAMQLQAPADIGTDPLSPADLSIPTPGSGEILMRVSVCGVCHTDLHTVEGELDLPKLPVVPGHQVVGRVVQRGAHSTRFRDGQRVGLAWIGSTCQNCEFCRADLENLCPEAQFTGLHRDGGYAQYVVADERFVFALPNDFSDVEVSPLLCAGIIGYRSLRLSGIEAGGRMGLFGFGASAHLAIQVARHWECEVYVFTRSELHRRHAYELGAAWAGTAEEAPPAQLDAAVTFAPAGWIVPHALSYLRAGGTVAINAIHMSPIPELSYNLIYGERVLRSVANFTRKDAEQFLQLAADIPIKTHVESFPLSEANAVLRSLKRSEFRGAVALEVD